MGVIFPAALISRTVTPATSMPLKVRAFHSSHVRPSLLACARKARCSYMVLAVPIQILTRSRPTIGLTNELALSTTSDARAASKPSVERFSKASVQGCSSTLPATFLVIAVFFVMVVSLVVDVFVGSVTSRFQQGSCQWLSRSRPVAQDVASGRHSQWMRSSRARSEVRLY